MSRGRVVTPQFYYRSQTVPVNVWPRASRQLPQPILTTDMPAVAVEVALSVPKRVSPIDIGVRVRVTSIPHSSLQHQHQQGVTFADPVLAARRGFGDESTGIENAAMILDVTTGRRRDDISMPKYQPVVIHNSFGNAAPFR